MDDKWCWQPEVGLLAPDAVVYLDMPVQYCRKTGQTNSVDSFLMSYNDLESLHHPNHISQ